MPVVSTLKIPFEQLSVKSFLKKNPTDSGPLWEGWTRVETPQFQSLPPNLPRVPITQVVMVGNVGGGFVFCFAMVVKQLPAPLNEPLIRDG